MTQQKTKPEPTNKHQFCCPCGARVNELYVTTHGEVCRGCLTDTDVAPYPEFAAQIKAEREATYELRCA